MSEHEAATLLAEVRKLRAERDALKDIMSRKVEDVLASGFRSGSEKLHRELAAAQARERALREAIEAHRDGFAVCGLCDTETPCDDDDVCLALATPADNTALREFGRKCITLWEYGDVRAPDVNDEHETAIPKTVDAVLRGER